MEGMNLCVAYPNKFSYSETFIRNQIEALNPQVQLYEGWHPARFPDGSSFLPFPLNSLYIRGGLRNTIPNFYHRQYTNAFVDFLKKNNIQLVLGHYGPMGTGLADACEKANVPLVIHFHGFDAYHYPTLQKFGEGYKQMFRQVKAVITVSRDMEAQVLSLGAPREKVYHNPYGVNLSHFQGAFPIKQAPLFITVGRFAAKKAPLHTLKAFAKVKQLSPEARLIMVGEGELWEEAKKLAGELGIAESVDFKGKQTPPQVAGLLQTARAFVQHSLRPDNGDSEGTPNSVLEAAATGLPVVSTKHAGIKDAVIHGESGFLVEEGDIEGMADYMYLLATDARLAAQMGQRGRQHMEENYAMPKRIQYLKEILYHVARN